jgi:hypothetical protein
MFRVLRVTFSVLLGSFSGCGLYDTPPDQSQFAPLQTLRFSQSAMARVYAAPIPGLEWIAVHTWLVVKAPDSIMFDRWEVWQTSGGPYGHVRHNLQGPESGVGAGGVVVLAELIGEESESIVEFVSNASPEYPCRDVYVIPGPNSNSFTGWVLDRTGWEVRLPASAVGQHIRPNCP